MTTLPSEAVAPPIAAEDDDEAATLTALLDIGSTAERGTVLYAPDDEPTVALFGTIPAWRALEAGVDAGGDVRQLEDNLDALGYGPGLTVDDTFTSSTAAAIRAWETALGRGDPDGRVDVGDVVFLSVPVTSLPMKPISVTPSSPATPFFSSAPSNSS